MAGGQQKLAELFVEFVAKNKQQLLDALDQTKDKTQKASKETVAFQNVMKGTAEAFRNLRLVAVASIGAITSRITSLARAGLALSAEGQYITTQFQFLSREIANLFVPVIRAASDALRSLIDWFRSLDQGQQRALGTIVGVGVAFISATGAIIGITTAIGLAASVFGSFGTALIPIAAALTALGLAGSSGQNAMSSLWNAIDGFWQAIKPLADSLVYLFEQVSGAIGQVFQSMAQDTLGQMPNLRSLMERIGAVIRSVAPIIANVVQTFLGGFATVYRYMIQFFESMGPMFSELGNEFQRFLNILGGVWTDLQPMIDFLFQAGSATFADVMRTAMQFLVDGLRFALVAFRQLVRESYRIGQILEAASAGDYTTAIALATIAAGPSPLEFGSGGGLPTFPGFQNNQPPDQLTPQGGGFEDVRAAFRRFQEEAVRTSSGPAEQTANNTAQMQAALQNIWAWMQANGGQMLQALQVPAPVNGGPV